MFGIKGKFHLVAGRNALGRLVVTGKIKSRGCSVCSSNRLHQHAGAAKHVRGRAGDGGSCDERHNSIHVHFRGTSRS